MKKILYFLLFALISTEAAAQKDYTSLVNPFIGTGGHGHTYPGATSPFGMVQLSPDTRKTGWDGCGGYHYTDNKIYGFSHTHLSGTGISDYADLLFLPLVGKHKVIEDESYSLAFDHTTEQAKAGYYETSIQEGKVKIQLSTTNHSGFQKYTFKKSKEEKSVLIDLDYRDKLIDIEFIQVDNNSFKGKRISRAWAKEQHFYFYFETSEEVERVERIGKSNKYLLHFKAKIKDLKIRTGISSVDSEGAKNNLKREINSWSLEDIVDNNIDLWNKELSKIKIFTSNKTIDTIFYTALYHSFVAPNIFSDVDGRYRGADMKIHQLEKNKTQYTVFSLWDTFRATHPLFSLTQKDKSIDFIESFLRMYQLKGKLPMWELSGNFTGCMIGYHAVPVIVDAYFKGIRDFDHKLALEAMIASANFNELGKDIYKDQGVLFQENEAESVSKTLEYAYDDWCIARFAEDLGEIEIAKEFYKRSLNYRNLFNPNNKFMHPKSNGAFVDNFLPSEVNFNFTEANSWQYSLFAPHDIEGLKKLLGEDAGLENWLDNLFSANSNLNGRHQVDITGLIGQYAHGNEPSHHMAYLYNYANKPEKTNAMVHKILTEQYTTKPDGLSGNEDCGQMSSWYVLNALGLYSTTPGASYFDISLPIVDSAIIQLDENLEFKIVKHNAKGNSSWNNNPLSAKAINFSQYSKGGTLNVYSEDNLTHPQSKVNDKNFSSVPYFSQANKSFEDSLLVEINTIDNNEIQYRIEGDENWINYSNGFYINETSIIETRAGKKNNLSEVIKAEYFKNTHNFTYELNTEYNNQYNGGNTYALMDGVKSSNNYRTGLFVGFEGKNAELTIDLGKMRRVDSMEISAMQYINAWIFPPKSMKIEFFNAEMELIKTNTQSIINDVDQADYNEEIAVDHKAYFNTEARYVKIQLNNYGKCPDWHLGAGGDTWIFLDEIEIFTK